jgi:hypothetical protein
MRTTTKSGISWFGLLALAGGAALLPGQAARACGGFFCNQPQNPFDQPVAQTAENVFFAMERALDGRFKLEAHVQIFYTGPADRFSWVVPVDDKPELDVGTNQLFQALLSTTQPRFQLAWYEAGICREGVSGNSGTGGSTGNSFPSAPRPGGSATGGSGGGVDISFRGDVGPYDAAVIRSTDPKDPKPLLVWLAENKYYVSPEATRLIADYVAQEKHFVAIRLLSGKDIREIQPLVMRFLGPGPCVPLKLTSIAAIRDLRVNLWVLGKNRVVPQNFYEIKLNEARIDWLNAGSNYEALIKKAADEAGGNAFVTDYAGSSGMLRGLLFQPGRYNLDSVRGGATPPDALDRLASSGLPRDSQMLVVLRRHIPMPEVIRAMNVDERTFYNSLRQYWSQYKEQFAPFDPAAFVADLDKTIIQPLRRTQEVLDAQPWLTRLTTFISPEEMTQDPTFVMNPSLPEVALVRKANAYVMCGNREFTRCNAPVRIDLPSGGELWYKPSQAQGPCPSYQTRANDYDRGEVEAMPALARGWKREPLGEGVVKFENEPAIAAALRTQALNVERYARTVGASGGGIVGGGDGGRDVNATGSGCACDVHGPSRGGPGAIVLALCGVGLARGRRRRGRPRPPSARG